MRKTILLMLLAFISTLFLLACSGDNKPAEMAMKAAEEAVNTAKVEAGKYIPDEVKPLEESLASLKEKFAKKDFAAVVTEGQTLAAKAKEVMDSAKLKKEEMTASWTSMSQELPKMVDMMQSKVDLLSQAKKLPADLSTEKFAEAKTGLSALKEEWSKALQNFNAGNVADAVSSGKALKDKAIQIMGILGLAMPSAPAPGTPAVESPSSAAPAATAPAASEPEKTAVRAEEKSFAVGSVSWLQNALNELGADPKLAVDGHMGPATRQSVISFQKSAGLAADGKVGPATEKALKEKLAKNR
ncbi:MAG: putative peptidoglycan binding domain protein [Syntrophus sp. PtaU1.Bin005]|nr:MAG: putative peptidoglycan binding domain protein [Syntrophus sp. PtaB.Bin138]OPY81579.1 MAG: putative peptidoglycan binding domain protein [Syntrophus sp. PtaU1.Bin005]